MKKKRIITLIIALLLWGIGSFLIYNEGENNIIIISTALIIIVAFMSRSKKKD